MLNIDFAKLTALELPLIERWLKVPDVAKWFYPAEEWLSDFRETLSAQWKRQWLVRIDNQPAGYIQGYDARQRAVGPWKQLPDGTWGLDFFIAEARFVGIGVATGIVSQFAVMCWQDADIRQLVVEPESNNQRAMAIYREAGFAPLPGREALWVLPRPDARA